MNKQITQKVILGLLLIGWTNPIVAEAGIITPGDYTSDTAISVPNGGVVIDQAGTYDIKNAAGVLEITNGGTNLNIFNITGGNLATVNGDIKVTGTNLLHNNIQINNGTVTINGNFTYDANNAGITTASGELFNVGTTGAGPTTFNVKGDLTFKNVMDKATSSMSLMVANGTNTTVNVEGNLYFENRFLENSGTTSSGANALYAQHGATINVLGNSEIYSICSDPDALTAKNESVINLQGTKNKIVGNLSYIDATGGYTLGQGGSATAVFDGADSFWYGDEQAYVPFWRDSLGFLTNLTKLGTTDFTFQNGAEYIYMGNDCYYNVTPTVVAPCARAKYISAITLKDGGIINLQDSDIQNKFGAIEGLLDVYPDLKTFKHDFITVGDLKGSNGIFKLDLNVNDKTQSDMIFVESSTNPGNHYIDSNLTPSDLEQLSETNKLRFATVAAAASGVSFAAAPTSFANTLMDYSVLIGTETYDPASTDNATYNSRYGGSGNFGDANSNILFQIMIPSLNGTYANGTNWYMYGITKTPSKVALGMKNWADSIYGYAMTMDRLHNRLGNAKYFADHADGLWARWERSGFGASDSYSGTQSYGQLGYDKMVGESRVGIALDYGTGKTSFDEGIGSSKHSRQGITLYNTLFLSNNQYVDFVACYGKIGSDLTAYTAGGFETTSDYDNKVFSLSAEYGKKFNLSNNFFIEPEAQMQYTHLGSGDYITNSGIKGSVDSTHSLLGRIGFRTGFTTNSNADIYLKADLLHEFRGGQDIHLSDGFSDLKYNVGERNTWYDLGLGANIAMGDCHQLTFDLEKSFGSDEVKAWKTTVQYTYKF